MATKAISIASAVPWIHPRVRGLLSDDKFFPPIGGDYAVPGSINQRSSSADKINFCQLFIDEAARYSVFAACSIGAELADERQRRPRGFGRWLDENCNVSRRMAYRYISLLEAAEENRKVLKYESIRQALSAIGMGVERDADEAQVVKEKPVKKRMTRARKRDHILSMCEDDIQLIEMLLPRLKKLYNDLAKQANARKG